MTLTSIIDVRSGWKITDGRLSLSNPTELTGLWSPSPVVVNTEQIPNKTG